MPPLPAPNLDDRRFQDFVDDAKRLLQRRIPTWTDHNVHDPGVTLIEAVATIADQLSFRLNQVPERHHRKFLDLLGIRLRPPHAAEVDLTFRLSALRPEPVKVVEGTVVCTRRESGEQPVTFSTTRELVIFPTELAELRAAPAVGEEASQLRDLSPQLLEQGRAVCFSDVPRAGDRLYFGLGTAIPRGLLLLRIDCSIEGIGVDPARPPLRWEALTTSGWLACEVESDGTGGLNRLGDVELHIPDGHHSSLINGVRAAWVRAVVTEPADHEPAYSRSPVITRVTAGCIGGSTRATHSEAIAVDLLGPSDGTPGQRFRTRVRPILAEPQPVLEVAETDGAQGWRAWTEVPDFADSDRDDPHYVLDRSAGVVELGPAVRRADGSFRSFGLTPSHTCELRLVGYRAGGGASGNVPAATLTVLRASIPYIKSVINRRPATGGHDGESVAEAKVRAPQVLRSRDRAVCAEDFELIAQQASGGAARITCLPPLAAGGPVRVLVVPDVTGYGLGRIPFPALTPTDATLSRIASALDERRLVSLRIAVEPPRYQGITVAARLRPKRGSNFDELKTAATQALYQWFHPRTGGADGQGWPFGRSVTMGDVHAALSELLDLDYVEDARLYPADPTTGGRGEAAQRIAIEPDMLPFSYDHQIQVTAR